MSLRLLLSFLLVGHGVAHLVGFVVPWKLMTAPQMAYRTTVLAGWINLGDAGIRAVGVIWLAAGLSFVLLGAAVMAGAMWRHEAFIVAVCASLVLCILGWPDARWGLVANVVVAGFVLALVQWGPLVRL